ncbi:MAG: 30S ribosomal protein S2 [Candidatus Yanofskybacteria bacterium]|nr:30S ribosomal protein S2 [Candidatus Yanofskybacteria bacterium]
MPEANTIESFLPAYDDMVRAGMHFGRKKTVFHPNMKPYVYTLKDNIYILDLIKTADSLTKAVNFLNKAQSEGKMILLVGPTKQSADLVKNLAESLAMPYVVNRWLGGTLTNFKTITNRVKYLEDLEKKRELGDFDKFTKKERINKEKEILKLGVKFDGLRKMTRMPDVIFVSSLKEGKLPVHEAKVAGNVKIVAIVNTDSDPKKVDYPIAANDNSRKSVELIIEAVKKGLTVKSLETKD